MSVLKKTLRRLFMNSMESWKAPWTSSGRYAEAGKHCKQSFTDASETVSNRVICGQHEPVKWTESTIFVKKCFDFASHWSFNTVEYTERRTAWTFQFKKPERHASIIIKLNYLFMPPNWRYQSGQVVFIKNLIFNKFLMKNPIKSSLVQHRDVSGFLSQKKRTSLYPKPGTSFSAQQKIMKLSTACSPGSSVNTVQQCLPLRKE